MIDAIIDGHVQGIATYLGLAKTKEDKPVTQERNINVPSKWEVAAWAEVTDKGFLKARVQVQLLRGRGLGL
ncbi:hypothetical protein MKY85_20645 [Paenibacillus sp. FSL R5-0749]|uniref:hypothetical protein n=1 Tax=Paenibacillus sp. FSL R5-0749 TaxID=2921657 RepID=UPI00315B2C0A